MPYVVTLRDLLTKRERLKPLYGCLICMPYVVARIYMYEKNKNKKKDLLTKRERLKPFAARTRVDLKYCKFNLVLVFHL